MASSIALNDKRIAKDSAGGLLASRRRAQGLWPQDCGEGVPIAPKQKKEKDRDDEREWQSFGGEEDMEEDDVHYNRAENGETEWHEATEDQKKAADDLAGGDGIDVVARNKSVQKIAGDVVRQGRHREELQKPVRAKDNEDQTKENPDNDRDYFHGMMFSQKSRRSPRRIRRSRGR